MDNDIAYSIFGTFIYWHGVIIALAAAAAVVIAALLYRAEGNKGGAIGVITAAGFIPAFILGRLYYCHFAQTSFSDKREMLVLGKGGIALYGVAAGYAAAAVIYCLIKKKSFAMLADAAAPAAAFAIAIGRCASFFSGDDIGRSVSDESLQHFPFALYSVKYGEWRTAVFVFEAAAAAVIFLSLLIPFFRKYISAGSSGIKEGDVALLFLLFYGVSQTVFESMRSDSMLLISLGFVRAAQVISIVLATLVFVIFSIRSASKGITWMHITGWALSLCAIALAFWMEFCITSANAFRNYLIMSLCLLFYMFTALAMYLDSISSYKPSDEIKPAAIDTEMCDPFPPQNMIMTAATEDSGTIAESQKLRLYGEGENTADLIDQRLLDPEPYPDN